MKRLAGFCVMGLLLLGGIKLKADYLDFDCNLSTSTHCTGSVSESVSGNYSTTGIDVWNDYGPYAGDMFVLAFNTATDSVSLTGTGAALHDNFIGDIFTWSATNGHVSTDVQFSANWPTIPALAKTWLGTPTGQDSGSVITLSVVTQTTKKGPGKAGKAGSVDVLIEPIPEPGSFVLVGTGLLALATVLRRKMHSARG